MRGHDEAAERRGGLTALDAGIALAVAVAAALWDSSFHVVPAAGGSFRGISAPPGIARVVLAAVIGAAVALAGVRFPAPVRRPLLALGLAALPIVPVVSGRLLPLLVFQGGLLRLVAAGAVAVSAVRLAGVRGIAPGRAPLIALFAAAFAFYAAWGERFPGAGPQGDEPHYLVMAQSLLSDGDLDLTDEFAGREYAGFYGGDLAPHTSPNTPRGRLYSMHSPGLPALLLPAYAAGGYRGARLLMSALAALAAALLYRLVLRVLGDERIAAAAWALAAFSPPLPFYAVTLYPETLAALAIVVYLLAARSASGGALAWAALFSAVLPWAHTKYIPLAAAGLLFTLLRPHRIAARALAAASFVASLFLLAWYFRAFYGSASFTVALGPADVDASRAPWGIAGAFLDRQYGLLAVAPALALAIPGAFVLWRRRTGDALRALVLVLLVILPAGAYVGWWGGAAPPARYVLPVVGPMLLAAAAVAGRGRDVLAALGVIGLVILGFAADSPRILRNRPDGESLLLRALSPAADLNAWLPSFVEGGAAAPLLAATLAAAAAVAWHWRARGLVAAAIGYALVAHGVRDRPIVDRGQATQRLLWEWDERRDRALSAASVRQLSVPLEMPRRPWTLAAGEARNSRRVNVPPGAYRLVVRSRAVEAPATIAVEVFASELVLATADVDAGGALDLPLLLPAGGRGIAVSAAGTTGTTEVLDLAIVPEALVPPERRASFPWPEAPFAATYRAETDGVRVTVLDRSAPEGGGFRVRGSGSFLVEAPPGATVRRIVERRDGVVTRDALPAAEGVALGRASVFPVRVEAEDARVSFAIEGR